MKKFELWHGDCIELMKNIPDGSVDLVLTDIPYGEVNRNSNGLRKLDKEDEGYFNIAKKRIEEAEAKQNEAGH